MCIRLDEISSYSKEIVNFIQSHKDAYTGIGHLQEGVDVPEDRHLFNIINGNQIVGFFIVVNNINKGKDNGCEIEIGIFDNYKGKRIAEQTIKYFLENHINKEFKKGNKCVYAVVNKSNKCFEHMTSVLGKCNFKSDDKPSQYKENKEGKAFLKKHGMALPTDTETKELIYYYKL